MLQMSNNQYEPEFKEKVLRLYLEEGWTKKSLTEEFNLEQGTLTYWLQQQHKEYQTNPQINVITDLVQDGFSEDLTSINCLLQLLERQET